MLYKLAIASVVYRTHQESMADYDQYDDATLERMLADAVDYEKRSAIRQEIRKRKKVRGQQVGRPKKGGTGYNRFAGSTAPLTRPPPKNYIFQSDGDSQSEKPRSTTPSKKQESAASPQSPVARPRTPTPPPTPEQPHPQPEEAGVDEPDVPPHEDEEAPVSPPPSPEPPAEPMETTDGVPNVELGEEGAESEPHPSTDVPAPIEESPGTVEDDPASPKDRDETDYSKQSHQREHNSGGSSSTSSGSTKRSAEPRTLADYQKLTARSKVKGEDQSEDTTPLSSDELQKYLVAYVNQELNIHPPMPVRGKSLFDTCSDPANLCKLINLSVRNTVDLRALTKISASMSAAQRAEALQDNMTLVIESARAIGCRVEEDSIEKILEKNPQTIRDFLVDLIRARVVHLPGMEDEPSGTFTNMATLFSKLGISVEETDGEAPPTEDSWRDDREKVRKALESSSPAEDSVSSPSPTGDLTYEERAARRKAEREQRQREADSGESSELSYEERAAQRKAERERKRKEREALAK